MSPPPPSAVLVDPASSDFSPPASMASADRTLLLCPPALSADPTLLATTLSELPPQTDVQMLDRVSLGLAVLPASTYRSVVLLTAADKPTPALDAARVFAAMKPGGTWTAVGGGTPEWRVEKMKFLAAGFVVDNEGATLRRPESVGATVALKLRRRKDAAESPAPAAPPPAAAAVGFVNGDDDDEDELIDEDELMADESLATPVQIPPECAPRPGKRRRACKDCTCGLKEQIEEEDRSNRAAADAKLKLTVDDLAEIDFTVEGKASSCGNCYLGDAFRCAGCPYVGLPAFKPGEKVMVGLGDDQL